MSSPHHLRVLLSSLVLLLAAGTELRADCPLHPADLAPGVLGMEAPTPTWTVIGDGSIDVQDVLAVLRTAVGLQLTQWSPPVSANCPALPGDIAPGVLDASFEPPRWSPMPDGSVDVGDVLAILRMAVSLQELDPAFLRVQTTEASSLQQVLTGRVVDSVSKLGVPGVEVSALSGGEPVGQTSSDEEGVFMLQGLPATVSSLVFDGSTSTAPTGKFSSLQIQVETESSGTTSLRSYSLPNEEDPAGASGKFMGDESGTLTEEVALASASGEVGLATGPGGKVSVDDEPADGEVDLSVVPLDSQDLPGGIQDPGTGEEQNSTGYVAVGPSGGKFTAGAGAGLSGVVQAGFDLTLPNRKDLPLDEVVDIWRWDGLLGEWVNHTLATGFAGVVVALDGGGSAVFAAGAATEGGIYAAAIPLDLGCASGLSGRVVDGEGRPLAGIFIDTSHGAFTVTDEFGTFFFGALPAYTGTEPANCLGLGYSVRASGGVALDGATTTVSFTDEEVFEGGFNDTGDIVLELPDTGCLSGLVVKNGAPQSGPVSLSGAESRVLDADEEGRFFAAGLEAGDYTASFLFPGEMVERDYAFDVLAQQCRTVRLELNLGAGSRRVEVLVLFDHDEDLFTPALTEAGAIVQLHGTDAASSGGLIALTGQNGRAVFEGVDGPFTVVAQIDKDLPSSGSLGGRGLAMGTPFARIGAGLSSDASPSGQIALSLRPPRGFDQGGSHSPPGQVFGTIDNVPPAEMGEFYGVSGLRRGAFDFAFGSGFLDPFTGDFFTFGWFEPFDLAAVRQLSEAPFSVQEIGFFGPFQVPVPMQPGETPELELQLDYSMIEPLRFDNSVPVSFENLASGAEPGFFDLLGRGAMGRSFAAALHFADMGQPFPSTLMLPDPGSAGALPFDLFLEASADGSFSDFGIQYCLLPFGPPLPAGLTVPFLTPPSIDGGPPVSQARVSEVLETDVLVTNGVNGSLPGFDAVVHDLELFSPNEGEPLFSIFTHYLPKMEQQQAFLPPTPLPFVFPDGDLLVRAEKLRSAALPTSFDEIFSHSLDETLLSLLEASVPTCLSTDNLSTQVVAD